MHRKLLIECFDMIGLIAVFLAFTLAGCAPVAREELDSRRARVTPSNPAQHGINISTGVLSAAAAVLGGSTEISQAKGK